MKNSVGKQAKAFIAKADQAKEKSEQYCISAGQHLKVLKAKHDEAGGSWAEWELKVQEKAGIHKSRASELMLIADGTKTAESVAADRRERQRKAKEITKQKSSVDDGENNQPKPKPSKAQDQREIEAKQAHIAELEHAHEHDRDLAERLRAAEIRIVGLEGEIADMRTELVAREVRIANLEATNAELCSKLEAAKAGPVDDGIPEFLRRAPAPSTNRAAP
jgi:hypothetical protein